MKKLTAIFIALMTAALFFSSCSRVTAEKPGFTDLILESYSCRSFKSGTVPEDVIETILICGQKAPSAINAQPWHFTVITGSETARQVAPRHYAEGAVVIVVSGKSDERAGINVAFDCALAAQNINLAAQSLGLGARMYYSGVQNINDGKKGSLGIPDEYNAQIIMLIGYPDDSADASASASIRRPVSENVNFIR